jgi:hypothetical protein
VFYTAPKGRNFRDENRMSGILFGSVASRMHIAMNLSSRSVLSPIVVGSYLVLAAWAVPMHAAVPAATPTVFCFDGAKLAAARERLAQGDKALKPAFDRLRADADEALQLKPVSVMDKTRTPPSGNKHDYISQAPYFWPDATKPDGLPYIRKDGERNPEVDRGTDRPAIGRLLGAVNVLSLAYYFTGNEVYAAHAAQLVRTWFLDPATRMNPHFDFAQYIPGINTGRGIGLIETSHLGHMCDDLTLIGPSGTWTKSDDAAFREWLTQYFTWLTTSKNGRDEAAAENNHGSWYDVQAASLAFYLGKNDLAKQILATGVKKRLEFEIEPSGAQPRELARTKSLGYSTMNMEALFTNARLADHAGLDWWQHRSADGRSLLAALKYLAPYADPAKPWRKKDIIEGERGNVLALVAEGSQHWDDPELKSLVEKLGDAGESRSARWHLLLNIP